MMKKRWILLAAILLLAAPSSRADIADALNISERNAPGVIFRHYLDDLRHRWAEPWLYEPYFPARFLPVSPASLITIQEPCVSDKPVTAADLSTGVIRIRKAAQP